MDSSELEQTVICSRASWDVPWKRRNSKAISGRLFHATKEVVGTHGQGIRKSAQGLCIRKPMASLEMAQTHRWHVGLPCKPFLTTKLCDKVHRLLLENRLDLHPSHQVARRVAPHTHRVARLEHVDALHGALADVLFLEFFLNPEQQERLGRRAMTLCFVTKMPGVVAVGAESLLRDSPRDTISARNRTASTKTPPLRGQGAKESGLEVLAIIWL